MVATVAAPQPAASRLAAGAATETPVALLPLVATAETVATPAVGSPGWVATAATADADSVTAAEPEGAAVSETPGTGAMAAAGTRPEFRPTSPKRVVLGRGRLRTCGG